MGPQFGSRVVGLLIAVWLGGLVTAQELPKDAQLLVGENAKTIAEIKKTAENQTKAANDQFRAQLEKLQTAYTKDGKLDEAVAIRDYLRRGGSQATNIKPQRDPGTLSNYRSEVGRVMYFQIIGSNQGTIYGTDVYTHDSRLDTAAVHAGVVKLGEEAIVKVTILPGQSGFKAAGRNGVSSMSWSGTGYECFKVELATATDPAPPAAAKSTAPTETRSDLRADPGSLAGFREYAGKSLLFEVTGANDWPVYGSDIYTDDSPLNVAVVHAGILGVGKKGIVKVTILGSQDKFENVSRNGVTSRSWGSWGGSYKVESVNDTVRTIELKAGELKNALIKELEGVKSALQKP